MKFEEAKATFPDIHCLECAVTGHEVGFEVGFLAGLEAAAKVADEDEALYTGEAIEAAVAKRIRDAIRALESPKGGDAK